MIKAVDLRNNFLDYFRAKGHAILPSASLIPAETDPTVLFTTAGMQPLVPYLMGEKHPSGNKLANLQRCIRTGDIDEVGDKSHLTFFEMMGYWSLGDYWKREAIVLIFDFLTKEVGLNPDNFAATCFEGDEQKGIPRDTEAFEVWRSVGLPEQRIAYLGYEDNWWGPAGKTGPCGPDSELFVWVGEGQTPAIFDPADKGWMELCNDVFMQYNKTEEGEFEPLIQRNVDFGMGFERLVSYINQEKDIYMTDLFSPVITKTEELSGRQYSENIKEFRVIADHLKAAAFIINDGVTPSNKGAGYVVRRLLSRAWANFYLLNKDVLDSNVFINIYEVISKIYSHQELDGQLIKLRLQQESDRYKVRIKNGVKLIREIGEDIDGKHLFDLHQSYGISPELVFELVAKLNINLLNYDVALSDYKSLMSKHQDLSRTASAGMFKGGLADSGQQTTRLHTVAHLLLASLRRVLGDHVMQKGSNITAERLRFDFSHPDKMTDEQKKEVEDMVNEQIKKDLPVEMEEMTVKEAEELGAMGAFKDRYGDKVKVYTIGDHEALFSKEICGGPHVANTGELGHFKIKKEESSSSGVRRIKAVLE